MGRFYENFEQICKTKGKSPSAVVLSIGRSKNAASNWKINGTIPKQDELEELAEVLNCSVADFFKDEETRENDYFTQTLHKKLADVDDESIERGKQLLYYVLTLNDITEEKSFEKQRQIWDKYRHAFIRDSEDKGKGKGKDDGNADEKPVKINLLPKTPMLDDYEQDFIRIYESLDAKTRIKLMNAVYEFDTEGEGK